MNTLCCCNFHVVVNGFRVPGFLIFTPICHYYLTLSWTQSGYKNGSYRERAFYKVVLWEFFDTSTLFESFWYQNQFFLHLFGSPHEPLCGRVVRPVEGLGDEDVNCGSIDRRVQEELQNESGKRWQGHVETVHQVRNDEVPELQELLGDCGGQEARQER